MTLLAYNPPNYNIDTPITDLIFISPPTTNLKFPIVLFSTIVYLLYFPSSHRNFNLNYKVKLAKLEIYERVRIEEKEALWYFVFLLISLIMINFLQLRMLQMPSTL